MRKILIILMIIVPVFIQAQVITLEKCQELARENYPARKNISLYEDIAGKNIEKLNTALLPGVSVFGKAQYQSDVTKIDVNIPNVNLDIPEIAKDQYQVGISLDQLIWDGGIIEAQKDIEKVSVRVNTSNVETELYKLREKVNDAYFSVLLADERIKSIDISIDDLTGQFNIVKARVDAGYLLGSNADILDAQLLSLKQTHEDVKAIKSASIDLLNELTGLSLTSETKLELPTIPGEILRTDEKNRPEYKQFDAGREKLGVAANLVTAQYMPKLSAYAQAAYGRPGLNMFDPDFQPFYIVGVKASWDILNWGKPAREKESLELQKQLLDNNEEAFSKNIRTLGSVILQNIKKLGKQIESDLLIIKLKEKISKEAESRLRNGVITSTEYLIEFNAAAKARLDMNMRKIELVRQKVNYRNLIGITN